MISLKELTYQEFIHMFSRNGFQKSEVWRSRDFLAKKYPDRDAFLYSTIKKNLVEELVQNQGIPYDDAVAIVDKEYKVPMWKFAINCKKYAHYYRRPIYRANTILL